MIRNIKRDRCNVKGAKAGKQDTHSSALNRDDATEFIVFRPSFVQRSIKMSTHETSDPIHLSFSRKISRRTFSVTAIGLGLSASAAGSLLTACGSDTNGSGQSSSGQITVWTWPDNDKTFAKTIPIF